MNTSWYKEPWAWFVFFLPFSAVVAGIVTYFIANDEADPLVVGDYYKKGKIINVELGKIKEAQKLGITFALKLEDNELVIKPTGLQKEFVLLNANFYHPTQEGKDFYLSLTADGNGVFRQVIEEGISGKWKLTLSSFNNNWKISQTVYLPQSDYIPIVATPNETD